MTAVATFPSVPRAGWANGNQNSLNQMAADEVARLFNQRKGSTRNGTGQSPEGMWNLNGGGSGTKKKANRGAPWSGKGEVMRVPGAGSHSVSSSLSSVGHQPAPVVPSQQHLVAAASQPNGNQGQQQSFLILYPLNDSFDPKCIPLPFYPETLRIGRQTNVKTVPTSVNGFFDSKVLSRQHAEVWAEKMSGRVWIRDVKSSNGTFVNGTRLSQENRDSEPHELRAEDVLELGIDIVAEDNKTIIHHKVAARVEHAGFQTPTMSDINFSDLDSIAGSGPQASASASNNSSLRSRSASQGSRTSGNPPGPINHRQLPMLLQTVSVEQIAKRLNSELHMAKQQSQELQRTARFFDSLIGLEVVQKELEYKPAENGSQSPMVDSGVALESPHSEHASSPISGRLNHLVTTSAECSNGIPPERRVPNQAKQKSEKISRCEKPESPQHLLSLVSQLRDARLELEVKSAKVRDLEDLLRHERTARERAEDKAARLELTSLVLRKQGQNDAMEQGTPADDGLLTNGIDDEGEKVGLEEDGALDNVSIAGSENTILALDVGGSEKGFPIRSEEFSAAAAAAEAAAQLHKQIEEMMAELHRAKEEIESYKLKTKLAEEDSERSRRSLAEMVASLRADEERRRRAAKSHAVQTDSSSGPLLMQCPIFTVAEVRPDEGPGARATDVKGTLMHNSKGMTGGLTNGFCENPSLALAQTSTELKRAPKYRPTVGQSAPYYSIVGVVVLGVGIMTILNSLQKGER